MNYSSPGDIIEVYSGTYPQDRIRITKENISLLGISHELGEGNDSGKPFIRGNGTATVIQVEASHVIVSNFKIENAWSKPSSPCIYVGTDTPSDQNNNTISDCIIRNSTDIGIGVGDIGKNIRIINNEISHCDTYGINAPIYSWRLNITGNVITDCLQVGIHFSGSQGNASGNRIKRCRIGIFIYGGNNIVYGNDIENCSVGVYSSFWHGNTITKNNFKNYSRIRYWWERSLAIYFLGLKIDKKDRWISNYWDTWDGVGPKKIFGNLNILIIFSEFMITIPLLWFDFDWHPAQEPYDIPEMN